MQFEGVGGGRRDEAERVVRARDDGAGDGFDVLSSKPDYQHRCTGVGLYSILWIASDPILFAACHVNGGIRTHLLLPHQHHHL